MKGEFYFEAVLIDCSMLEDRLSSLLFHFDAISERDEKKLKPVHRDELLEIYRNKYGENEKVMLDKISGKNKLIRAILEWADSVNESEMTLSDYMKELKSKAECVDIEAALSTLDKLNIWCKYRNEIIHSVMTKNIDALYENLSELAQDGMEYARFLDAQVKCVKRYKSKQRRTL